MLDLNKISEIYGDNSLYEIRDNLDNLEDNISYLKRLEFNNIYDYVEVNPYLFLVDNNIFKSKINTLISNLGINYKDILENDISYWGRIEW